MRVTTNKLFKRTTNISFAFILTVSSLAAAMPFLGSQQASAEGGPQVVYSALPSSTTNTSYASEAYLATSTSEFGDYIHLNSAGQQLNNVTVTMVNWAKQSAYSSFANANANGYTVPVTLNIYDNQFDASGTPTHQIATVTQDQFINWRPESDPSCGDTSNGKGWTLPDSTACYDFSGIAQNITFDMSSLHTTLPSDVVVTVGLKTSRDSGVAAGPYDVLNIAVPSGQTASPGSDNSDSGVVMKSTWSGAYGDADTTGILRKATNWSPNGTVALQVTAIAVPTLSVCATPENVATTSLSAWTRTETRATGHDQLLANGLRVWTESNTSTDKAAGYHVASFDLADLGEGFGLNATGTDPTPPSLQLTVDLDGNGTLEGNLVAEPAAYGANTLWLSSDWTGIDLSNAPTTINGGGTGKGGSINAWLAAFPNAKVHAVGYSLGSGVKGDFVITKITAGCTNYTFGLAAPTNLNPIDGTYTNNPAFADTWSAVEGAAGYEYRTAHTTAGITAPIYQDSMASQPSRYSVNGGTVTRQNGGTPEGTYFWQVRAVDSRGNQGPWSAVPGITVDTTAPNSVILTAPANDAYKNVNDFHFTWNAPIGDVGSPLHYEFQSSQNSSRTDGVLNTNVWKNTTSPSAEQNYLATPQIHSTGANGTWYWQARAVDAAGNVGPWSTIWTLNIDTSASAAPTNAQWLKSGTLVPLGAYTNQNPVTPAWTSPATGTVSYYEYSFRSPTSSWSPWESVGSVSNLGPNVFDHAGNNGTEGEWQYMVRTVNKFGARSPETTSPVIIYDRTNPNSTNDLSANVSGDITIHQTITDNIAPASGKLSIWKQNTDGSLNNLQSLTVGDINVDSSSQVTYSLNTLSDLFGNGAYTAKFTSTDKAGNSSLSQVDFSVNNAAPILTESIETGTIVTPTITGTAANARAAQARVATVYEQAATDNLGTPGVLGTQAQANDGKTSDTIGTPEVKGASTQADQASGWALAWYWWLLIVAAAISFVWWLIARRRNLSEA